MSTKLPPVIGTTAAPTKGPRRTRESEQGSVLDGHDGTVPARDTLLDGMRRSASGHETAAHMLEALPAALSLPLDKTYVGTMQFIHDHPFFHQGLMELPIGFGKHFRNVPFIGPGRIIWGLVTLSRDGIAKGVETTRGTWDAA